MNYLYQHPWLFSGTIVLLTAIGIVLFYYLLGMIIHIGDWLSRKHPKIGFCVIYMLIAAYVLVCTKFIFVDQFIRLHQTPSQSP